MGKVTTDSKPKSCFRPAKVLSLAGALTVLALSVIGIDPVPARAAAGINQQINFQARLLNAQGATVPDGNYNLEFKIYQDGPGTLPLTTEVLKWTETRLNNNSQGVVVKNGYFSVMLGAVNTALNSSVDFNQDTLWLSVNVASTNATCTPFASCSPDGEMTPFKRLAANPYALNSGKLGGLTSSQYVQLGQGLQVDASTSNASIAINKTGATANILDLQRGGADVALIDNNGTATFQTTGNNASLLVKQTATASPSADIFDVLGANGTSKFIAVVSTAANAGTVTVQSIGGSNALTLDSGSGAIVLGSNTTSIQKSGAALSIDLNTAGTSILSVLNSNASNVANLDVEGGLNIGSGQTYKINSTQISSTALSNDSNLAKLNGTQSFTGTNTFQPTTNISSALIKQNSSGSFGQDVFAVQGSSSGNFIQVTSAAANTGAVTVQSLGSNTLTLESGGTINVGPVNATAINLGRTGLGVVIPATGVVAVSLTGVPAASTTSSLVQLSAAIAGGSANGTYVGANPSSFSGDFVNLQVNGTSVLKLNSLGDVTSGFTLLDGSSTTNGGSLGAQTNMTLASSANFNIGNYIKLDNNGAACNVVTICYAKITNVAGNVLTISPALTWSTGRSVVEYHIPEIGGVDLTQGLTNRYGRGYFIAGVTTGNGSTEYNDGEITSNAASFNLLNSTVATLNIGGAATSVNVGASGATVTIPGSLSVTGTISGSAPATGTSGYFQRNSTNLSPATAGDNITTSGNISTSGSGTITAAGGASISNGLNNNLGGITSAGSITGVGTNITGSGVVSLASGASSALNLTGAAASTWDIGTNTLSLQTAGNGAITTGTGLLTQGGNVTFSGTAARTITGPTTGGLTETVASGPLTLSTTTSGTIAVSSAGALNLTGAAVSTWDIGNNLLSLQTTNNGAITTGTGLLTQGGNVTFSGTSARTITGPSTGGLTATVASGPLTLSTTASGTLAVTSAGALNLTGAAPSTWDLGANTLSLQTTGNGAITTGTGLLTQGGNVTFSGTTARTITGPSTGGLTETVASGPLTLSTTTSGTLALTSAGALNLTGAAPSTLDIGNNLLSVQTTSNGAITTGTGLLTQGGNVTFSGSAARTITGPTTGGLTATVASGPLTLSTTTSGTLAITSAGALNLTGAAPSTWDVGANLLSLQTSGNGAITTGTGLLTQGGNVTFSGSTARTITGPSTGGLTATVASGPLTLSTTTAGTLALSSAGALNFTGSLPSTWDIGNNLLSLQTTGNGAITTGTGLLTQGGNVTFSGTAARTITGPSTGGLTTTVASGPLTLSTTTSGTIAITSAGALNLTGAAPSTWDIGANTLSVQTTGNGAITTGTGLVTTGGALTTTGALTVNNSALFKNTANSTSAFQIQNLAGAQIFKVDTTANNSNNLLTNPSIESAIAGNWQLKGSSTVTQDASQSYYGANSLKMATTTAGDGAKQNVVLASTTAYSLALYARVPSGNINTFEFGRSEDGSTDVPCLTAQTVLKNGWTRLVCSFTTGTVSGTTYVYAKQTDSVARATGIFIDSVTLETDINTTSNYHEAQINLQASITSPLVVQNSTNSSTAFQVLTSKGSSVLTVDTTDTNILAGVAGFENNTSGWSYSGTPGSIQRDSSTAYIGTFSLKVITTANANNGAKLTFNVPSPTVTALSTSSTYTLSWYAKLDASSAAMTDIIGAYARDGSTETNCTSMSSQTVVTGGWTRFTCQVVTDATTPAANAYIVIKQTAGAVHTFYIDGVQIEPGSNATAFGAGSLALSAPIVSPVTFRNKADSTTAFQIQNAAGTANLFTADTLNNRIGIGITAPAQALDITGNAQVSGRVYAPGTSGTAGQGFFTGTATTPLGAFQSLDLGGNTYSFIANNKYYNGSAWVDNGQGRTGSSFQIQNDNFNFYSFDTATNFTSRLTVASGGNVGVGNSAPSGNFQVAQVTGGYGTVQTFGTTSLTGTGTNFTNTFKVGDTITVSGEAVRTIATITDDTHLTVTVAFTTASPGHTYTLTGGNRLTVLGNGNIGIGTSTPSTNLHVVYGGGYSTYSDVTGATATLGASYLEQNLTDTSFTNPFRGAVNKTTVNFGSDPGAKNVLANYNEVGVPSGSAVAMASLGLRATNNVATYGGTNTLGSAFGTVSVAKNMSTGTITNAYGVQGAIQNNSTGTIGTAYGINVPDIVNTGTIATTYGVYVGDMTTGTQPNTPYSFYASDANALNFFAGSVNANGGLVVGSATTDATQVNLQLDSFSTFADSGTCNATTNQGAIYYNTSTNAVRGCVNSNWEDLVTTGGLGIIAYGVVLDSGSQPGDLQSLVGGSGVPSGPCQPYWKSATAIAWTGCVAYSGGRKVIVAANSTGLTTTNAVAGQFQHLCLTGTGSQPALSTAGTEVANLPAWNANNPIACLADVKFAAANNTITNIYDTRVFSNSSKQFVYTTVAMGLDYIAIPSGTQVTATATAGVPLEGVIVSSNGAAWAAGAGGANAIMVMGGPAFVKTTAALTLARRVQTTTTTGYATAVALPTAATITCTTGLGAGCTPSVATNFTISPYTDLGVNKTTSAAAAACSATVFTCGSALVNVEIR